MHCAIIVVITLLQENTNVPTSSLYCLCFMFYVHNPSPRKHKCAKKLTILPMFYVLPFETTGATINVLQALNLEVPETVKALMTKEEEIKQANVE